MANAKQCDVCGKFFRCKPFNMNVSMEHQPTDAIVFGYKSENYPVLFDENTVLDICEDCKKAVEKLFESRKMMSSIKKGDKS